MKMKMKIMSVNEFNNSGLSDTMSYKNYLKNVKSPVNGNYLIIDTQWYSVTNGVIDGWKLTIFIYLNSNKGIFFI
jgi:hypothetical protein